MFVPVHINRVKKFFEQIPQMVYLINRGEKISLFV